LKYSTRELTLVGILSATNGVIEIGMGTLLHIVKMPLAGTFMLLFNLTLYFLARKMIPRTGVIVIVGLITAILKLMYAGADKLMPAVAIFSEAVIVEIISALIRQGRMSALFSGAAANSFTLIFPFLSYMLFGGARSLAVIESLITRIQLSLHCQAPFVISLLLLFYIFTGLIIGLAAWNMASLTYEYTLAVGRKALSPAAADKK